MGRLLNQLFSKNFIKRPRGFTLTELLIVIALIGVLASVLVVIIDPAKQLQKSRDTKRKSDIAQIQHALELYRSDIDAYPSEMTTCNVALTGTPTGQEPITYLNRIPCDPSASGVPYQYAVSGSGYEISFCLENNSDTDPDTVSHDTCPSGKLYRRLNP
jgi:general secretion pathway protein G